MFMMGIFLTILYKAFLVVAAIYGALNFYKALYWGMWGGVVTCTGIVAGAVFLLFL